MASLHTRQLPLKAKLKTLPALSTPRRAFIIKADRFAYHCLDSPGPGAYDSPPDKKPERVAKQENWAVPKQHLWIISKGRQPFQIKRPCEPQLYSEEGEGEGGRQGRSDWAKDQRFHYARLEQKSNVGPGKYSPPALSPKQRSHTLPLRDGDRASPTSYIKQLIQQARRYKPLSDLEQELLRMKIKAIQISKQAGRTRDSKAVPSSAFKSSSKRLYSERELTAVGPGSYELETSPVIIKKPALKKSQVRHERAKSSLLTEQAEKEDRPLPGPGTYELQLESHKKAALGLILREERFNSKGTQASPGPGEYMQKRFIHLNINEIQQRTNYNPFTRHLEAHPTFGTTERFDSKQATQLPFGQYDLGYNDISQKLIRQRQHQSKQKHPKGNPSPL